MLWAGNKAEAQNGSPCYNPVSGLNRAATPVQTGTLCVSCNSIANPGNITDASKTNFATLTNTAGLLAGSGVSVRDTTPGFSYPGGWYAGYLLELTPALLTANVINSLQVQTYLDGTLQETFSVSANLASVNLLGGGNGRLFLQYKTGAGKNFDEIRLISTSALSLLDGARIYYAMAFDGSCGINENNGICGDQIAGPGTYASIGGEVLNVLNSITNLPNLTDGNKNTFATYNPSLVSTGLLGDPYIAVKDVNNIYPGGNRTGFVISTGTGLLTATVLNNFSVQTYLHGVLQETQTFSNGAGLLNVSALSIGTNDKVKLAITTTLPFNEVRLVINPTIGAALTALNVYDAFEEPVTCTECRNALTSNQAAPYTGAIQASRTGTFGVVCIGQSMSGTANLTDASLTNFATYTPAILSVGCGARIAVTNGGASTYPVGTFAGFALSRQATLLDLNILNAITINTYNSGTLVQSQSGPSLLSTGLLNPTTGMAFIGLKSTVAFNEVQIVFDAGLISASLGGTYNIYYAYVIRDDDNDGVADCIELCGTGNDAIDTDGDGTPDACDACNGLVKAATVDTDGDGVFDACDADSDNDGIADVVEDRNNNGDPTDDDTDGDGIANYLDLDSDNDGIPDLWEAGHTASALAALDADLNGVIDAAVAKGTNGMANTLEVTDVAGATNNYTLINTDGDAAPNYVDLDSDNDGINDIRESGRIIADTNGDGMADGEDGDRDGILNTADNAVGFGAGTLPVILDTDGDGVPNVRDLDSDNDGINDIREAGPALTDANGDGMVDGTDTDGDGILGTADGNPAAYGDAADPVMKDSDGDGVPDARDLDSDNDTVSDMVESGQTGYVDTNNDGVVDGPDADGDGIMDSVDGNDSLFGDAADFAIKDADTDGVPDYNDLDSDGDAAFDITEFGNSALDPNNDGRVDNPTDPDGDGIANNNGLDQLPAAFGGLPDGRPDLIPTFSILSTSASSSTPGSFILNINETRGFGTSGEIAVTMYKPAFITFNYDPVMTAMTLGTVQSVNNPDWNIVDYGFAVQLTSKAGVSIPGGQRSRIGIQYTIQASVPVNSTFNVQVDIENSGNDSNTTNNSVNRNFNRIP